MEVAAEADAFFDRTMRGHPWVGVHLQALEGNPDAPRLALIKASSFAFVDQMVKLNPSIGVYLLSDSPLIVAEYQQRYGSRLLNAATVLDASRRAGGPGKAGGALEDGSIPGLLALKCDYFIGSRGALLSESIATLRDWPQGRVFLLDEQSDRGEKASSNQPGPDPVKQGAAPKKGKSVKAAPSPSVRKLHIGGKTKAEGWEVLNANPDPCVDHVCNANDLSRFADNTFGEIYGSHIVEHLDYSGELQNTLKEWHRVLAPGGTLYISVPDLDVLAGLMLAKDELSLDERFLVMRMIFGGHVDKYDYHYVGLNQDFLASFLGMAGFVNLRRVPRFGLFDDTSNLVFKDTPISLNVIAEKPKS
jgi:predicted SAM-dependent methyltransferase